MVKGALRGIKEGCRDWCRTIINKYLTHKYRYSRLKLIPDISNSTTWQLKAENILNATPVYCI
jgi:hypothetical protein